MGIVHEGGVSFDEDKWAVTLITRGLDFADAGALFDAPTLTIADERFDYGEKRNITFALASGRMVVIV